MADTTNTPVSLNAQFEQWLMATPLALAKFVEVIKLWYENQGKLPPEVPGEGPVEFKPGDKPQITTIGISNADLDALYHGYAQAVVKDKAIAVIKAFIAGVMFAAV